MPISIVPGIRLPYTTRTMEGSAEFLKQLEAAIAVRRSWLDGQAALLKDAVRTYQQRYQALFDLFLRKGLIREDPYDYGQTAGDVAAPTDEPFLENERYDQVSWRLDSPAEAPRDRRRLLEAGRRRARPRAPEAALRARALPALGEPLRAEPEPDGPGGRAVRRQHPQGHRPGDRGRGAATRSTSSPRPSASSRSSWPGSPAFRRERWKADLRARALPAGVARPVARRGQARGKPARAAARGGGHHARLPVLPRARR